MELKVSREGDLAIVEPQGAVDTRSAPELEQGLVKLLDEGATRFVCDFARVDLLTSAGIRVLVMLGKKLQRVDGAMVICGLNEYVHSVFEVSGLLPLFTILPSRPEALARLPSRGAAVKPASKLARTVTRLLSFGDALPSTLALPPPRTGKASALASEVTALLERAGARKR